MDTPVEPREWWREPMVWLVVGLPLAAVLASFGLIYEALRTHASIDDVNDEVQHTAQVQQTNLGPDEAAAAAQLTAVLYAGADGVRLLPVNGDFDHSARLKAVFAHPMQHAQDRTLQLDPAGNGWKATSTLDHGHDWLVTVTAPDGSWRIRGRLKAGASSTPLGSSLAR